MDRREKTEMKMDSTMKYMEDLGLYEAVGEWRRKVILPNAGVTPPAPAIGGLRDGFGMGYTYKGFEPELQLQLHAWSGDISTAPMVVMAHALRLRVVMRGRSAMATPRILADNALIPENTLQMHRVHGILAAAEILGKKAMKQASKDILSGEQEAEIRGRALDLAHALALELESPLTRSSTTFSQRAAVTLVFSLIPEIKGGSLATEPLALALTPGEVPAVTFAQVSARSTSVHRFSLLQMLMGEICSALRGHHPDARSTIPHGHKPWGEKRDAEVQDAIASLSPEDARALAGLIAATEVAGVGAKPEEDAWNMMARNLEYLTIPSLVELGRLVEEYNEGWAVAAFDWLG